MEVGQATSHDKRYVGRAEALMRYIEERAKTLMLGTRLAIEEWELAVDYAIWQHNHMPHMPALSHLPHHQRFLLPSSPQLACFT